MGRYFGISGLIPAHAGKTQRWRSSPGSLPAHPRSRGENIKAAVSVVVEWGSSPLTRGKLVRGGPGLPARGLIPAHAGKTDRARRWVAAHRAHPRSRGENPKPVAPPEPGWGSSPLTRGKLHARDERPRHPGLIPAHAGKTSHNCAAPVALVAHPRSRGENFPERSRYSPAQGSSPLTRGKLITAFIICNDAGLIPAHAGKTSRAVAICVDAGAHPRSRGENNGKKKHPYTSSGSSPLTRGKRGRGRSLNTGARLIPAHAGKTPKPKK